MSAKMYDKGLKLQAGFPANGKYDTYDSGDRAKFTYLQGLRVLDEQDAINRYKWFNLPNDIEQQLERILYYRGSACIFKLGSKFYCLPYTLAGDGTVDIYGRYTRITPVPFNGQSQTDGKEKAFIEGLSFAVRYDVALESDFVNEEGQFDVEAAQEWVDDSAVIIYDYSRQFSQTIIPRVQLQEPILQDMRKIYPYAMTALANSTGITGMRVNSDDESASVEEANDAVEDAALTNRKFIAIKGGLDFQVLTGQNVANAQEFLLSLQSLDNYRLSLLGCDSGGLFQKKQHMLGAENEMNEQKSHRVLQDGLNNRQNACNIMNSIWFDTDSELGGVWCMVNESESGMDIDGDGTMYSNQQPSATTEGGSNETDNN